MPAHYSTLSEDELRKLNTIGARAELTRRASIATESGAPLLGMPKPPQGARATDDDIRSSPGYKAYLKELKRPEQPGDIKFYREQLGE